MASLRSVLATLSVFLILQCPWLATSDNLLAPVFAPIVDKFCDEVACGKGTCKASTNSTFGFECECEPGWKQARPGNDTGHLKFMPCVIPNCTLDSSCTGPPQAEKQANTSLFDPCHWADCGGGICNKTSPFMHSCVCNEGYYNLLNFTAFPCFRECALGMDCKDLGLTVKNNTSTVSPSRDDDNGSSISRAGGFSLLILLVISIGLLPWR